MQRKRRKLAPPVASRISIASPLVLLVSTSILAPARANQIKHDIVPPLSAAKATHTRTLNSILDSEQLDFPANPFLVPSSILDVQNSSLMRKLLLTHGIELNLSQDADKQFVDETLLREIFENHHLDKTVDFELLLADASDALELTQQPLACEPALEDEDLDGGVSKEWQVLWIGSCEAIAADPVEIALVSPTPLTPQPAAIKKAQAAQTELENTNPKLDTNRPENSDTPAESASTAKTTNPVTSKTVTTNEPNPIPKPLQVEPLAPPGSKPNIDLGAAPDGRPPDPAKLSPENTATKLDVSDDVPEGFEALAGPQTNYIDIFFNGRKVGSTVITSTPDDFEFDDPAEVAMLLPDIADPSELEALLAFPLPTNGDKICYDVDEPPGCGRVLAEPVAAIYNEGELSVQLFLAPELQTVQSRDHTRYLQPPESKNTSILSVYAVGTDLEDEPGSVDLSARGVLGYGRGNIHSEFDYNSRSERQRLRALNLAHYFPDHELQLGTYSFQPRGALTDFDLLAASFSTSLKTRVDLEHAFSSELVVFLANRSVVRLVVDDRVYSGDSYDAGNQVLDTRALPDGTYQVEIRILDPVTGDRTERRLFTKSTQIPPKGETQYALTAGVPLLFDDDRFYPIITQTTVVGGSFSRRLTDQSAYWLGLLQFGSRSFLQAEFLYLGDRISFQFTSSVSADNTVAAAFRTSYSRNSLTGNLSFDVFKSDFKAEEDSALEQLFPTDFQQVNFSLSKALKTGYVGFRSSYRTESTELGNSSLNQYALFYRRPVFRRKNIQGLLETNIQQDDVGRRINLQFRAFFNKAPLTGSLLTEASFDENQNSDYLGSLGVNWHHDSGNLLDYDLGAYASVTKTDQFVGASTSIDHPWFSSNISTDWNSIDGSEYRRSSIATLSAHAGADRDGVALGGADFAQAGVIVSIKGQPRGERFDIEINGIKASTGEIGKAQFIGLQPFENYRLKLIPKTVLSNGIGEEIYEFTLYPGSVQRIDLVAKKQVLLIATLVNKFGELVENAVIERDPNPLLVEEGGFFQAEVTPGERIIVKPANAAQCEFVVPESEEDEVLVLDSPLLCVDSQQSEASLH